MLFKFVQFGIELGTWKIERMTNQTTFIVWQADGHVDMPYLSDIQISNKIPDQNERDGVVRKQNSV